jgi:hypothetical protein
MQRVAELVEQGLHLPMAAFTRTHTYTHARPLVTSLRPTLDRWTWPWTGQGRALPEEHGPAVFGGGREVADQRHHRQLVLGGPQRLAPALHRELHARTHARTHIHTYAF